VVTRLDVARRIGCVLSAARAGLALVEAGIGPGAADGLVPLTADFLARRLLEVPQNWERRQ
jgi:flagellar biosynthesis protein FlhF